MAKKKGSVKGPSVRTREMPVGGYQAVATATRFGAGLPVVFVSEGSGPTMAEAANTAAQGLYKDPHFTGEPANPA